MHEPFMRRCLELAVMARGRTGVNPLVGAVLVRDGRILCEAYHEEFGKSHAELHLLQKTEQIISAKDILYVNLEPCCHENKKTNPCTDAILKAGIQTVVYGMKDPNPEVAGKGIELLNKKSIQVLGQILEQECQRLNRGFISVMTQGRPWITLKKALTREGLCANENGSKLKITSAEQDKWSHQFLRVRHDAILVGVTTIIADDPLLTVRHGIQAEDPWRIILDPDLRTPLTANVVQILQARRTMIVTQSSGKLSPDAQDKREKLSQRGVRIVPVPFKQNSFDLHELMKMLITPSQDFFGISSILVEGGMKTWKSFLDAGLVDEEVRLVGEGGPATP